MNQIDATISKIESFENVNIVSFEVGSYSMKMISLELENSLKIGSKVQIGTKATHISLAKNLTSQISISNILHVRVKEVNNGELLSSVKFYFNDVVFESIITKESSLAMDIKENDKITALIQSSELSIIKVW